MLTRPPVLLQQPQLWAAPSRRPEQGKAALAPREALGTRLLLTWVPTPGKAEKEQGSKTQCCHTRAMWPGVLRAGPAPLGSGVCRQECWPLPRGCWRAPHSAAAHRLVHKGAGGQRQGLPASGPPCAQPTVTRGQGAGLTLRCPHLTRGRPVTGPHSPGRPTEAGARTGQQAQGSRKLRPRH